MAKITLPDIAAQFASTAGLNARFQLIEDALNDGVLWKDPASGEPNSMLDNLDMDSNRITNLPDAISPSEAVPLSQATTVATTVANTVLGSAWATAAEDWATAPEDQLVDVISGGNGTTDYSSLHHAAKSDASATASASSASAASTSETNAGTSETNAATSETNAGTSETNAGVSETNAAASAALAIQNSRVMTEAEFNALTASNRSSYAGSGFIEYGKHNNVGSQVNVNEGLYTDETNVDRLVMGRITTGLGTSAAVNPLVNMNGVIQNIERVGTTDANDSSRIQFPAAPLGNTTYDSATGTTVVHADSATAFAAETATNLVVVSRQDLVMLESWTEEISDTDVVYPLGNVQYAPTTWEGIALSSGLVAQTYSAFGVWDTVTVGYGVTWSTLSTADQATFLADPQNNIYMNASGVFVQARYRIRVIEGLGDAWDEIDTQLADAISYDANTSTRINIRAGDVAVVDFASGTDVTYKGAASTLTDPALVGNGQYLPSSASAYTGAVAIPIALVQRRNQAAYDPSFNPHGTSWANATDTNSVGRVWYVAAHIDFLSQAEAFAIVLGSSTTAPGYVNYVGKVANGISGRSDGLYYDAIVPADVLDLRNSARASTKSPDYWLNKAVANEIRHYVNEGVPYTVVKGRGVVEGGTTATDTEVTHGATAADYPIGSFVVVINQDNVTVNSGYVGSVDATLMELSTTYTNALAGVFKTFSRTNADTYIILKVEHHQHKSETITWIDVVGDPSRYPRQWTGVIDFTNDNVNAPLKTGDTVELIQAATGGSIGDVFLYLAADLSRNLTTQNYGGSTVWKPLGTKATFLANAIGFEGFPLLYDEDGADLIPDGTSKVFKNNRKSLETSVDSYLSVDQGQTWLEQTWAISNTLNSRTSSQTTGNISLVPYLTPANIFTDTVKAAAVYGRELSKVTAAEHYDPVQGSSFGANMIGKVPVSTATPPMQTSPMAQFRLQPTGELATSSDEAPVHPAFSLGRIYLSTAVEPACKAFVYPVDVSNQYMLNSVFQEMIYDSDADRVSDFTTIDGSTNQTYTAGVRYKVTGLEQLVVVLCVRPTTDSFGNYVLLANGDYIGGLGDVVFTTWDGIGWGDDATFTIADNTDTATDDNANTILVGTKQTKLPFFLRSES
jgi:hypothetical protein